MHTFLERSFDLRISYLRKNIIWIPDPWTTVFNFLLYDWKFHFFSCNFQETQNSICYALNIWLGSNCKMLIVALSWHSSVTLAYRKKRLAGSEAIHIEVVYLFLFKKQTDKLISPPFGTQKRINVCQIEKHKTGKGKKNCIFKLLKWN